METSKLEKAKPKKQKKDPKNETKKTPKPRLKKETKKETTKKNKKPITNEPITNEPITNEPITYEEPRPEKIITQKLDKLTGERKKIILTFPETPTPDIDPAQITTDLNDMELKDRAAFTEADPMAMPYLYPNLNDPNFNINIAERSEFNDTKYDGEILPVKAEAELLCNAEFELAPHQLFVSKFLSFQTPYNSLLLYHGLGSGKTCSAISIAEEMRDYLIQMNMSNKIIIVASPNVQDNFKLQLFDESKLRLIDGMWNIRSCTGNKFLKEINPMNMKGMDKETVVKQIKALINNYYEFLGYTGFANAIQTVSKISDEITGEQKRTDIIRKKIQKKFSNRMIIIDEVHNIRISDDNPDKKRIAQELFKLVTYADNMRLLLLSATPMYNSYKEIIWILKLMNLNDRRSTIDIKEVFKTDGNGDDIFTTNGREILERKATGYISYVRGENPYTFPYKLFPDVFAPEHTFETQMRPVVQLNNKDIPITANKPFIPLYLVEIGAEQNKGYEYIINKIKQNVIKNAAFETNDALGYTLLQKPIEALNMIYPDARLSSTEKNENIDLADLVGTGGLDRMMTWVSTSSPPARYDFEYKPSDYGSIFSPEKIRQHSSKISAICDRIVNSTGVVLVYSQYIDGGLLPIALALEERGFTRAGNVRSLFKNAPHDPIDATTFKTKKETVQPNKLFQPAKYVMITGNKELSPNNVQDISISTDINNKNGTQVKVILISLAGSEGLDLKFIRQVHVLDPWYNMNRIEQIIGRAVRTCSHKDLEFEKRNVEIYLYGTLLPNKREEAADLYIYRLAEQKAIQIGKVTRLLKEIAVDCILNVAQSNFIEKNMNQTVIIQMSSGGKSIEYKVGDKAYSAICDYMEDCNFTCKPNKVITAADINNETNNEAFIMLNNDKIIHRIKMLMKERFFYRRKDLINRINHVKDYPEQQINSALQQLIEDNYEYITDKFDRLGHLINIGDLYLFQPLELTNPRIDLLERSSPIEFKHDAINIDVRHLVPTGSTVPPPRTAPPPTTTVPPTSAPPPSTTAPPPTAAPPTDIIIKKPKSKKTTAEIVIPKPAVKNKLTLLLESMLEKYELAKAGKTPKRGVENWYRYCSAVIDEMQKIGMARDVLIDAMVAHMCDELQFEEKKLLLNAFAKNDATFAKITYGTMSAEDIKEFIYRLKKYLFKHEMNSKGLTGIYVQNTGENILFIKPTGTASSEWTVALAEDENDMEKPISTIKSTMLPAKSKLNDIVGYMMNFKKNEEYIVFKMKVFKSKGVINKRNTGIKCYNKSLEKLTEILGESKTNLYIALLKEKYKDIIADKQRNRVKTWFDANPTIYKKYKKDQELKRTAAIKSLLSSEMYKEYIKIIDDMKNKNAFELKDSEKEINELLGEEKYNAYLELLKNISTDNISLYKITVDALQLLIDADKLKEYIEITTTKPDDLEAITHIHACVIQEMFLRVYDILKTDGKRWFLTPEEAILIDIEKLSL